MPIKRRETADSRPLCEPQPPLGSFWPPGHERPDRHRREPRDEADDPPRRGRPRRPLRRLAHLWPELGDVRQAGHGAAAAAAAAAPRGRGRGEPRGGGAHLRPAQRPDRRQRRDLPERQANIQMERLGGGGAVGIPNPPGDPGWRWETGTERWDGVKGWRGVNWGEGRGGCCFSPSTRTSKITLSLPIEILYNYFAKIELKNSTWCILLGMGENYV